MTSGWLAALVAMAMLVGAAAGALWRAGRREGKLDAILEQLKDIAADHEERIRANTSDIARLGGGQHARRR